MTKKQRLFLLITAAFFAAAILLEVFTPQAILSEYGKEIESYLLKSEREILSIFDDKKFLIRQLNKEDIYNDDALLKEKDFKRIQELAAKPYFLSVYLDDDLFFWNNNKTLPFSKELQGDAPAGSFKLVQHQNGAYYQVKKTFLHPGVEGKFTMIGLIPIKQEFKLQSDYLTSFFNVNKNIPNKIKVTAEPTNQEIKDKKGNTICFLESNGPIKNTSRQWTLFLLYLFGFIGLAIIVNYLAGYISKNYEPIFGIIFLSVFVFGLRAISIITNFTDKFSDLPLFERSFDTNLTSSLGDLIINTILLLWVMIVFHKEYRVAENSFTKFSKFNRFGVSVSCYFTMFVLMLMVISVFKILLLNSNIDFDFENVLNFDVYSFLAVIVLLLLMLAAFLFCHRMILTILQVNLSRRPRIFALFFSTLVTIPFAYLAAGSLHFPILELMLIAFVLITLFDLFIDYQAPTFSWLVIWLLAFSIFPTSLIYKYQNVKMANNQLKAAQSLSSIHDPFAEKGFLEIKEAIQKDEEFKDNIKPFGLGKNTEKLRDIFGTYFSDNSYLYNNYIYDIYLHSEYDTQGKGPLYTTNEIEAHKNQLIPETKDGKLNYLMPVEVHVGPTRNYDVVIDFLRKKREKSKVYTELLLSESYKKLQDIENYSYAVYKDNKLYDYEGGFFSKTLDLKVIPKPGKHTESTTSNVRQIVYHGNDGSIVRVNQQVGQILDFKIVSLFSYLFTLIIIVLFILSLLNFGFKFIPDTISFTLFKKPSLKNKIQIAVITLVVLSFLIIGIVTGMYFKNSSDNYHEARLERKTRSVLADTEHELSIYKIQSDSINSLMETIIKPISEIHRMDLNVYDLNGNLIQSSEDDIFNKGIISTKMNSPAFFALSQMNEKSFFCEEEIGGLKYKAAYVPIKTVNNKTVAYFGLPYYAKQRKGRSDVTTFLGTLLNAYVFLLIIAGGIAIIVADSITKPIQTLGEKMKEIKLGQDLEEIPYPSQDEIGTLISQYNRMIKDLDESAEKLKVSEREGAWREMAKQVAHEIKNPLTPMKLSIQYLEHAFRSKTPEEVEELIKRVSGTLIQQIDNLAQIASEFSNFAKMPRANNKKILLNQLVTRVYELFSSEGMELELKFNEPAENFYVFADSNHLTSVLNNVFKNAQQAIPDGRQGKIEVDLYRKDDTVIVKISDNGSGIPEDKRDKVFVPNFTTKSSGTGIGLAISQKIIETVNGVIRFETEVNIGTQFFIELPIVEIVELENVG